MTGTPNDLGTHTWVERTGGLLTAAERAACSVRWRART